MTRDQIRVPTNGMLDLETARVIFDHLQGVDPVHRRLVEVGTGFGHSTRFFARCLPTWTIYTIDAFGLHGDGRVWSEFAAENILRAVGHYGSATNVMQILGNSRHVPWELPVDVAYIDADHTYDGCGVDRMLYGDKVVPGGLVIFDDYTQPKNPTNGVARVVQELIDAGNVEVLHLGIAAILKVKTP